MLTSKQEKFLEKMRRSIINSLFTDADIKKIESEGLLNELFIDNKNLTLLMYYVRNNDFIKVKDLLSPPKSVKVNIATAQNKLNALHLAIDAACISPEYNGEIIDELLKFNPTQQLLQKSKFDTIPLHIAAQKGNLSLVKKLLQYNAQDQLKCKDINQTTVLLHAMQSRNIELITWLIETYPMLLDEVGKDGFTLMHHAARLGDLRIMNLLLEKGDKKQLRLVKNSSNRISLIVAATHGHIAVVQRLLEINPTKQLAHTDKNGNNAFHCACILESEDLLRLFLSRANKEHLNLILETQSLENKTPLAMAVLLSNKNPNMVNIIKLLINAGSKITVKMFESLIDSDNIAVIEAFLQQGFDLNQVDAQGNAILNHAVLSKKPKIVKYLLDKGADANLTIRDNRGKLFSPLLLAMWVLDFETIQLLKNSKADMDNTTKEFIISTYGKKHSVYKQIREIFPELPDMNLSVNTISEKLKEKENVPEYHSANQDKMAVSGRGYLLEQGYTAQEFKSFKSNSPTTMPGWRLEKEKAINLGRPLDFLGGSINSNHEAISPIDGSDCYCYLDAVTLQIQGFDIKQLKISRYKFSPDNIKLLDKDKGIYKEMIKLSPDSPPKQMQYTHELKINDLDRILMIQEGSLLIGLKYIKNGLHTQGQIKALHESTKENGKDKEVVVQWPEGIYPGRKVLGISNVKYG